MKNIKRTNKQLIMKVDELSRSLLENAPCPITAINPDTSLKYANPAFERLTGFSLPEIVGRQAPYPWWPEETWAKRLPDLKKLMAGANKTIDQTIQNKNGERFLVQLNMVRVVEKGTFKYHLAYWLDITERKQAEEALLESEEKYRTLVEDALIGIINVDLSGKITYVNNTIIHDTGYSREELIGKNAFRLGLFTSEMIKVLRKRMKEKLTGQPPGLLQLQFKCKDGRWIWLQIRGKVIRKHNIPVGIQIIGEEITERKLAEELIRTQVEVAKNMAEGAYIVGLHDVIIRWTSPRFEAMFGYEPGEMIGRHASIVNAPTDLTPKQRADQIMEVIRRTGEWHGEVNNIKKDGTPFWCHASVSTFTHPEYGEVLLAVHTDITERKQAEERVSHLNLTLKSIRNINQSITREKDRSKLLRNVCKNLVDTQSCFYAWVALFDESLKLLEYAESNIGEDFLRILEQLQGGVLPVCAQKALAQSKVVVIKDTHSNCRECPLAGKTNSRARLSVRLEHEGKTYGILCAAVPLHVISDSDELTLFQEVANDIAFALHDMELEEESKKSEEKNRVILERALDGFCIVNLKGKFLEVNNSYCRMVGYTREELLSMSLWDIEAAEKPEDIAPHIQKVMKQGHELFETRHRCKDGTVIDIEAGANYLDLDEGQIFVFFRDITERKKAEEALRESEEFSTSLLENSPDPIVVINPDTSIRYINPAFVNLTGFSLAEIIGKKSPYPWWTEETLKKTTRDLKGAMHKGAKGLKELFQKKSGERFWVEITSAPVISDGKFKYYMSNWVDITERKHAEEALRESEEKFSKAFRSSPDRIIITTLDDGRFVDVNDSYIRYTGYSREEVIGHTTRELGSWPNPEYRERIVRKLKKEGRVSNEEVHLRIKSGEIRTSLFSAEPIYIGEKPCMISVATDITERKQAEEALSESERKYRDLAESISDVFFAFDKDLRYTYWNRASEELTGVSAQDALGKHLYDVFKDDEATKKTEKAYRRALRTKKSQHFISHYELNGKEYFFEISAYPSKDGLSVFTKDITERRQAEEALRESEEKFSKAFRSSPDIISITTLKEGRYIEVNDSFTEITGYNRQEVIGRTTKELNTWARAGERDRMIRMLLENGRFRNEEFVTRSKPGKIHTMSISAEIIDIGGEPCIISVSTDITERKRAEERQRESENLRELDRLRTELLANISHELRTPLASIKGFATVLLEYEDKLKRAEKREYLETIDKNTDRLVELIEQLLDMSRLGVGMLSIEKVPTSISKLFQEVIAEVQVRAPAHRFTSDLPAKLPMAHIDARRIRQVLDNLLNNAIKHSRAGTEVTISARKKGDEILVTVTDQGVGIPKKDLPRVFERLFFSRKRHISGTSGAGLGLSICKGLVEAHGGRIWIESEEGRGTTCFFTLPIYQRPGNDHGKKG